MSSPSVGTNTNILAEIRGLGRSTNNAPLGISMDAPISCANPKEKSKLEVSLDAFDFKFVPRNATSTNYNNILPFFPASGNEFTRFGIKYEDSKSIGQSDLIKIPLFFEEKNRKTGQVTTEHSFSLVVDSNKKPLAVIQNTDPATLTIHYIIKKGGESVNVEALVKRVEKAFKEATLAPDPALPPAPAPEFDPNKLISTTTNNTTGVITIQIKDSEENPACFITPVLNTNQITLARRVLGQNSRPVAETPALSVLPTITLTPLGTDTNKFEVNFKDTSSTNTPSLKIKSSQGTNEVDVIDIDYKLTDKRYEPRLLTVSKENGIILGKPIKRTAFTREFEIQPGPVFEETQILNLNENDRRTYSSSCKALEKAISEIREIGDQKLNISVNIFHDKFNNCYINTDSDGNKSLIAVVSFGTRSYSRATSYDRSLIPLEITHSKDGKTQVKFPYGINAANLTNFAQHLVNEAEKIVYPNGSTDPRVERAMFHPDGRFSVVITHPHLPWEDDRAKQIYSTLAPEPGKPTYPRSYSLCPLVATLIVNEGSEAVWRIQNPSSPHYNAGDTGFISLGGYTDDRGKKINLTFPNSAISSFGHRNPVTGLYLQLAREWE